MTEKIEDVLARVRGEEADSIGCVLIKAADRDVLIDRMRGFLAAASIWDSVEKAQAARIAELKQINHAHAFWRERAEKAEARAAELDAAAEARGIAKERERCKQAAHEAWMEGEPLEDIAAAFLREGAMSGPAWADDALASGITQEREQCAQIADAEASIEGIGQRIAAKIRGQT